MLTLGPPYFLPKGTAMLKKIRNAATSYIRSTDHLTWALCLVLSGLSILLLVGICNTGYATSRAIIVQAAAVVIGLLMMLVISNIDYETIAGLWKLYLPLCYGLVLATFVIGAARGDDQAWITIGGLSLQPSELLKVAFILSFGLHLSKVEGQVNEPRQLILLCLHGAAPVLLIHLQGDDGSALMIGLIFVSMLFAAGVSWRYIAMAAGAAVVVSPLVWFFIMNDDHRNRFLIMLNPMSDPQGQSYQQLNGLLAIGSGQLRGTGLFSGEHVYVPEIRNDFIFSFLGNSMGFIGCLFVCCLLVGLCARLLYNSFHARDTLGSYICVGAFAMVAFQSILTSACASASCRSSASPCPSFLRGAPRWWPCMPQWGLWSA